MALFLICEPERILRRRKRFGQPETSMFQGNEPSQPFHATTIILVKKRAAGRSSEATAR